MFTLQQRSLIDYGPRDERLPFPVPFPWWLVDIIFVLLLDLFKWSHLTMIYCELCIVLGNFFCFVIYKKKNLLVLHLKPVLAKLKLLILSFFSESSYSNIPMTSYELPDGQ